MIPPPAATAHKDGGIESISCLVGPAPITPPDRRLFVGRFSQQPLDFCLQHGQRILDDPPNPALIEDVVSVNQEVTKRDHLRPPVIRAAVCGSRSLKRRTASPMISKFRATACCGRRSAR